MNRAIRYFAFGAFALAAGSAMADVTFYEGENFSGRPMTASGVVPDFRAYDFNDRARSAVVEGAPVEVCIDINFTGGCQVLNPGRYPNLGAFAHDISSMRPVMDPRSGYDRPRGRWASATLYSRPNMTGRAFTLGGEGAEDMHFFNDRARSLRVERGYWIFCSEPQFRGECRTFGPGEYAHLPRDLNDRIESGRRVSNAYPYAQNPDWDSRR